MSVATHTTTHAGRSAALRGACIPRSGVEEGRDTGGGGRTALAERAQLPSTPDGRAPPGPASGRHRPFRSGPPTCNDVSSWEDGKGHDARDRAHVRVRARYQLGVDPRAARGGLAAAALGAPAGGVASPPAPQPELAGGVRGRVGRLPLLRRGTRARPARARPVSVAPGTRLLGGAAAHGAAAGLLFAAGDVLTKTIVSGGARTLFIPAMVVAYALGTIVLQLGFQRGGALTTAGITTLLTNGLPIIAGTTLYSEPFPDGELGVLRGVAFALLIAGAVLLSRPKPGGEPDHLELELAGA